MSIAFNCAGCGVKFKVADSKGGHRAKCPKCGQHLIIPLPVAAAVRSGGNGNGKRTHTLPPDLLQERRIAVQAAASLESPRNKQHFPQEAGPPPATIRRRDRAIWLVTAGALLAGIAVGVAIRNTSAGSASPNPSPQPPTAALQLTDLKAAVDLASLSKSAWALAVQYERPEYRPRYSVEASTSFSELHLPADDPESVYIEKYRPQIAALLRNLVYLGKTETAYLRNDRAPVQFVQVEGQPCMLLTGLMLKTTYNSDQLSPKRRASEVVRSAILPALREFDNTLFRTDLPHFGLVCLYGTRSSLPAGGPAEAEVLSFVTRRQDTHQFIAGEISQEELLRRARVFLSDHDATGAASRIELTLE